MILSSVYHTFSCRSEKDYWCFLSFDLFGIALSMLSIYMSGVYYAFWCHKVKKTSISLAIISAILCYGLYEESLDLCVHVHVIVYISRA